MDRRDTGSSRRSGLWVNEREEAASRVQALALRVIADIMEREGTTTERVQFAATA